MRFQTPGAGWERAGDAPTPGSLMMRCASAAHTSQMKTLGPATSFDTSAAVLPQNEHASFLRANMATSMALFDLTVGLLTGAETLGRTVVSLRPSGRVAPAGAGLVSRGLMLRDWTVEPRARSRRRACSMHRAR